MADETTLLIIRECFVYRIPARGTAKGYRAADWDVNAFLWKGRLRISCIGEQAFIKLEDSNTGRRNRPHPFDPWFPWKWSWGFSWKSKPGIGELESWRNGGDYPFYPLLSWPLFKDGFTEGLMDAAFFCKSSLLNAG